MAAHSAVTWRAGACALVVAVAALLPPLARRVERSCLEIGEDLTNKRLDEVPSLDVVVVLGYALERDGSPTAQLKDRVDAGVKLYVESSANTWLVFSGGHPGDGKGKRGNKSEAESMNAHALNTLTSLLHEKQERGNGDERGGEGREKLLERAKRDWFLEDASTSTRENALFTLKQMVSEHPKGGVGDSKVQVAIVTSPFHQYRSLLTFEKAYKQLERAGEIQCHVGLSVAKVEEKERGSSFAYELLHSHNVVREIAAIAYYTLRGWL